MPQRTLILSFGFDEEISGHRGAKYLSNHLLSKLGHHSIASIVDEGAANMESWGAGWAFPGVRSSKMNHSTIKADVYIR